MSHSVETLNISDLYIPANGLRHYDRETSADFACLVEDIRKRGVLTAISVEARSGGHYRVLDGHARVKACKLLNIRKIDARVLRPAWMSSPQEWAESYQGGFYTVGSEMYEHDHGFDVPAPQKKPAHYVWVTATGKQLRPNEIMDGHLGNILRLLWRNDRAESHDFKTLLKEAIRRDLEWEIDPEIGCSFDIDGSPCESPMAMWTAAQSEIGARIPQEPRCEAHRTEKMCWKECAGCLTKKEPAFGSKDGTFWCYECAKPEGPLAILLTWLLIFLTLGLWRWKMPTTQVTPEEDAAFLRGRKYPEQASCNNCLCPSKIERMEHVSPVSGCGERCGCDCHDGH